MVETKSDLALYVHWPWCVRKCPYCDFNSYAAPGVIPEERYIEALLADLAYAVRDIEYRQVHSVFFGGGTPSLMSTAGFDRLMNGITHIVDLEQNAEITMEANPGTVEAARFSSYAAMGVNRFSIGVQSFDDLMLGRLGRIHTAQQAHQAIEAAQRVVDNINIDVMFALPGQTMQMLTKDLETAIASQTTHLSFYELTLEEGTAFAKRVPEGIPDTDRAADMGEMVHEKLGEAGFDHYEISGYAKPGRRCRHNLTYWTFGDYLGIGAGAHGKVTCSENVVRTVRVSNPRLYMQNAQAGVFEKARVSVQPEDIPFEFMLNALRLRDGVRASLFTETTGLPLACIETTLSELRQEGLLTKDESRIRATELGRRFLSDVQERFLTVRI